MVLSTREKNKIDVVVLDTAGRLHIDEELMKELRGVQSMTSPHQIFLVVDAMIGQDAVNAARTFHTQLAVDGVILTKFDSDTRGGAALSVKRVTGVPIKFIGTGEKFDALEEFHPERIASRILGMGDVLSLVEKAQEEFSEEDVDNLSQKNGQRKNDCDRLYKSVEIDSPHGSNEVAAWHVAGRWRSFEKCSGG